MIRHPSARDLTRETQLRLGEVLERQVGIAKHVLPTGELLLMLVEVATSTLLTTAGTIAATIDDEAQVASMFDRTIASVAALAAADRERALREIMAKRASAQVAA